MTQSHTQKRVHQKSNQNQRKQHMHEEKTSVKAYLKATGTGIGTAIVANLLLQFTQNQLDASLVYNFAVHWHTELFLLSTLILFVLYVWFTTATGNKWVGSVSVLFLSSMAGAATYYKMNTQQEPFYPNDVKMVRQIPFLLNMISPPQRLFLGFVLVFLGVLVYFGLARSKRKKSSFSYRTKKTLRMLGFVFSTAALIYVGFFNQSGNKVRAAYDPYAYWIPYSQQMNYYNNGFVGGFLYNLTFAPIEQPEGYSRLAVQKIEETYTQKASELNRTRTKTLDDVNVVFIMNESFSDPLRIQGVFASADPIPFTRQLEERTAFGYALAPSIGGGTANSEFEALTGVSMEPLAPNMSSPYTQMGSKMTRLPSVARQLAKTGHYTTAIHPFNTTMYKRQEVYSALGFDAFLYDETMIHTHRQTPTSFISDEAAYEEVFRVLRETEGTDFVHLVTMHGHMPYAPKYDTTDFRVQGSGNRSEAEAYYQDLSHSDEALEAFVEQLDAFEEETLVVFWGDHLPGFYPEEVQARHKNQEMYETPLRIFSNRDTSSKDLGTLSPVFFWPQLLDKQEVALTPFQVLQVELATQVPAFEKQRYKKGDTWVETREELSKEANALLDDYTMILFDLLAGEQDARHTRFFEETPQSKR